MGAIVIVLIEESEREAEQILAALSEGGTECRVHRARDRRGLSVALAAGGVDVIVAAGVPPGLDARAALDLARATAVPVVVVARDPAPEEAAALTAAGAAAYVPGYRLEGLGGAVRSALDGERGGAVDQARRLREALSTGRRKDELLARVAHELRTPLNAMLGWASMLRTRRLDEAAQTRALETIERNARAEAKLIDDLLDLSRMLSGTLRLELTEAGLCPLVLAEVEAARPAAEAKGVSLSAAIDEATGVVAGDPGRIRQVIRELLANAVRATPRGGQVGVRLERAGAFAEIAVRDSGRGIDPQRLPRIFSALEGAWPAGQASPPHGSLGVGLSLVRHLVEAHGGAVVAESEGVGRGATFTVRLPLPDPS